MHLRQLEASYKLLCQSKHFYCALESYLSSQSLLTQPILKESWSHVENLQSFRKRSRMWYILENDHWKNQAAEKLQEQVQYSLIVCLISNNHQDTSYFLKNAAKLWSTTSAFIPLMDADRTEILLHLSCVLNSFSAELKLISSCQSNNVVPQKCQPV